MRSIPNRRLIWVDSARGLGIVLVVYGHAYRGLPAAALDGAGFSLNFLDYAIYTFHMPLFFFLSGLFARRSQAKGARRFWTDKLLMLVYPYLLWSLLQGGMQIAFAGFANHLPSDAALLGILWRPIQQFWFLYALFWCHVLFVAFRRASDRVLIAMAASSIVMTLTLDLGVASTVTWGFTYFVLGVVMADRIERLPTSPAMTAALCAAFAVSAVVGFTAGMGSGADVPAALCGIAATVALSRSLLARSMVLQVLGSLSMSIFVMHVIATATIRTVLLGALHIDNLALLLLAGTAAGILLPVLAHLVLSRAGLLPWFGLSNGVARLRLQSAPLATHG
jgi:fucose 4-O-acetylase-like acetyltransferase